MKYNVRQGVECEGSSRSSSSSLIYAISFVITCYATEQQYTLLVFCCIQHLMINLSNVENGLVNRGG